ncbi:alpha/beta fold hydrolase, partial [Nocardia gipuzkoensis]
WTAAEFEETIAGFTAMLDARHTIQLAADRTADIRAHLGRITAPTLVLGSARDRVVELDEQRAVAAGIAAAHYLEFDAGHALPVEDGPGFTKAVSDHLEAYRGR